MSISDFLFGRPLANREDESERIGAFAGVGVLGLDALASAAYGPEALLTVLMPLGAAAPKYAVSLTSIIVLLLVPLALSYRQTIAAYPGGGGAYTVVRENVGTRASLIAASALVLDYVLNVAVAISAGVGALVSAVPALLPHTLALCLTLLAFLTFLNLRGVRSTGAAFFVPTYAFVAFLLAVIGIGLAKAVMHHGHPPPVVAPHVVQATLTSAPLWLLARAFANGCTAMTGVEAVSNGVPLFRTPAALSAQRTLALIVALLVALLGGISYLSLAYSVTATPPGQHGYQSFLSQLTAAIVGHGAFYYLTLGSVMAVLALSANTSFADFPRVCRLLAGDHFLPEAFVHRGRRLTFSHGIMALFVLAAVLLVTFGGVTDALIPLFAIGALFAFTMSQFGMVAHWRKNPGPGSRRGLVLNGIGGVATALTAVLVLVSKFREGAWLTLLLIGATLLLFLRVRRHHDHLARATAQEGTLDLRPSARPIAVVPLRRWDAVAAKGLHFAVGLAEEVVAVQILTGDREIDDLAERWEELVVAPAERAGVRPPRLLVRKSEYRLLFEPLLEIVTELELLHPERQVAVVVPELVGWRWYHHLLEARTASLLKLLLLFRGNPRIVIVNIPWYLQRSPSERLEERDHRLLVD
jgi:amino acid transporter